MKAATDELTQIRAHIAAARYPVRVLDSLRAAVSLSRRARASPQCPRRVRVRTGFPRDGLKAGGEASGARRGESAMSKDAARARSDTSRTSLYDEITAKIIAELEADRVPWVQPWGTAATKAPLAMPRNAATGRHYSGINVLILWGSVIEHGFPGPRLGHLPPGAVARL